jgi:tetratricopeptide (TPR) repeat protein
MANLAILIIRRTYKVFIVIVAAVVFFLGYNVYLVDRSLVNLRFALNRIDNVKSLEDAKKISSVLSATLLAEVASKEVAAGSIAHLELARDILEKPEHLTQLERDAQKLALAMQYTILKEIENANLGESNVHLLEMARDILVNPQSMNQLEDVKFALREVIQQKEKKRSGVLAVVDSIAEAFVQPTTRIPKEKLERQAAYLEAKIKTIKNAGRLQDAYYELANVYTQLSEFSKAKEIYQKAIEAEPETDLARKSQFNMAWNEKTRGNLDEAIKEFEEISQSAPQKEVGTFSKYQVADILRKKGEYEKAIALYGEVARERPESELASVSDYLVGYTYLYDVKDFEKAKETLHNSQQAFKGSAIARHIEESTLPSVGAQYRIEGFRLLSQGYGLSSPDKYREALRFFDKALEMDPQDGVAYIGKALILLWLKDPEKALEFARKAVKCMPQDEIASVNLGYIYIRLNLIEDAIAEYRRFISVRPLTSSGYYNLGYAYAIENRFEEAAFAFQQAIRINPEFALAYNNQGWCQWQLGKYAEAISAFESAAQLEPKFADAHFNLGVAYKNSGKYREAKKEFEAALAINPQNPEIQAYLQEIEKILRER